MHRGITEENLINDEKVRDYLKDKGLKLEW